MVLIEQFVYLGILILAGCVILLLRRRAEGSKTGYKLVLLLLGLLLGILSRENSLLPLDMNFIKALAVFMLITLMFELSTRLNHENIVIDYKNVGMFFAIIVTNILLIGILSTYILYISPIHGAILAIILSSIEYFFVDQLRGEGDLANPLIIFFAFTIMVFYGLQGDVFENTIYLLKYLFIGLAMGVFSGIITFRLLRNKVATIADEIGMLAVVGIVYIITDQLQGSGLFAVMILGVFFGNSHVRKTSSLEKFSPKIFKTLEMLIYVLVGFIATVTLDHSLWLKALLIFAVYLLLRFVTLHFFYMHYSIKNKLLLTFAPKGMILGIMILVLGVYNSVESSLITVMLFILVYSLIIGLFVEHIEQERTVRIHKYKLVGGKLHKTNS